MIGIHSVQVFNKFLVSGFIFFGSLLAASDAHCYGAYLTPEQLSGGLAAIEFTTSSEPDGKVVIQERNICPSTYEGGQLYGLQEFLRFTSAGKVVDGQPYVWWGDNISPDHVVMNVTKPFVVAPWGPIPDDSQWATVTLTGVHSPTFFVDVVTCYYQNCGEANSCEWNAPGYWVGINIDAGPTPANIDLQIQDLNFPNAKQEVDGKFSTAPSQPMIIIAPVSAADVDAGDARSIKVNLTWPTQQGGPLTQIIPLASLANGAINNVQFNANFLSTDAGDQQVTVTVDPDNVVGDTNLSNNSVTEKIHVLCDVAQLGINIPFQAQVDSAWGSDQYDHEAGKTMKQLGCMTSALSMLFNAYGITSVASGAPMTPGSLNTALNNLNISSILGSTYSSFNGYSPNGQVLPNGVVGVGRNSSFNRCLGAQDNVAQCQSRSLSAVSYKGRALSFGQTELQKVNAEICKGNPVILEVSAKHNGSSHFVLAKAMKVKGDGTNGYSIMDPGLAAGDSNQNVYLGEIKGYRLYSPSADPDTLFLAINSDVSAVITDPQGRKSGFNPISNQMYSEIPGASFVANQSIGSITEDIFTPFETQFESLQPATGQYQVEVFATKNTSYNLVQYSYDSVGTINGISESKGQLKAGKSTKIIIQHTARSAPIVYSALNIEKADFFDIKRKDFAYLEGFISPANGAAIDGIQKEVTIQIGSIVKTIKKKDFYKYKSHGHVVYSYETWGMHGYAFEFTEGTGDFKLFIFNKDINDDGKNSTLTADVLISIDNYLARNIVKFKNVHSIDKHHSRKCHDHRK